MFEPYSSNDDYHDQNISLEQGWMAMMGIFWTFQWDKKRVNSTCDKTRSLLKQLFSWIWIYQKPSGNEEDDNGSDDHDGWWRWYDDDDDIYSYDGAFVCVFVCHVFACFAFRLPSWPKLEYWNIIFAKKTKWKYQKIKV